MIDLIGSISRDALLDAAKEGLEEGQGTLLGLAASGLEKVLLIVSGKFYVSFLLGLLRARNDGRMRRIEEKLDQLTRTNFETGLTQLEVALTLPGRNKGEIAHRNERFRDALRSLDAAMSVAKVHELPLLYLFRGMASCGIHGGAPEAALHLERFCLCCEDRLCLLRQEEAFRRRLAHEFAERAAAVEVPSDSLGYSRHMATDVGTPELLRQRELEHSSRVAARKAAHLQRISSELEETVVVVRAWIRILEFDGATVEAGESA